MDKLRVDEAEVEFGVVNHQRPIANKGKEIVHDAGKYRLVGEKGLAQPMYGKCRIRNVALRIEIGLVGLPGGNIVHELDAADLDDAMTRGGIEAGGFGVKDDLAHAVSSRALDRGTAARPVGPTAF